ncbi:hypothetical protein FDP41_004983 [Naegleria fowleri]|uniref:Uncharacterized protein n=1 Tax=Naegleria fowleri TaxID=5763 RepID=A0A6A5BL84_NAEFO|nr:uncharacterized protein FDP41_004983 [Naegleria fowleri]KAF0975656.1 hypothetical protein FDP41_004983 [Naegleria fowleri]
MNVQHQDLPPEVGACAAEAISISSSSHLHHDIFVQNLSESHGHNKQSITQFSKEKATISPKLNHMDPKEKQNFRNKMPCIQCPFPLWIWIQSSLSSVKDGVVRSCKSMPPLVTIMNVLVVFFLLQLFISVGTVIIVIGNEGARWIRTAEAMAHEQAFQKVKNALFNFIAPSEVVITTFHNHFPSFGLDPSCHTTWAKLFALASIQDPHIKNMYFGDKQKRWSQFQRGQESSSFVTIPCFGPNSFLSLSQVTECQLSHLKYNVSNTGVILSSEFIYENDNLKDVTSMEWYQLITQSFNISSQKGFENVIHLPLRQKYSMWSDVVESSKELSTFVSLLVRDPVNGSFVGVAALEYGLAELHDYMSSVLDIPHAVIVLDKCNHILAASLKLSAFSSFEPSLTTIQTFPHDFNNHSLFQKIFHEIQEEEESFRFNHTNVKLTVQNRLNGTTVLYDYSISIIISDNIVLKAIVITEHFQFFVSTINNSVTGWIILILILSLCIVVLLIVLKTITHPLHRLSKVCFFVNGMQLPLLVGQRK